MRGQTSAHQSQTERQKSIPRAYYFCPPFYKQKHEWRRTGAYTSVREGVRPEIECVYCHRTFYGRPEQRTYRYGLAIGVDDY